MAQLTISSTVPVQSLPSSNTRPEAPKSAPAASETALQDSDKLVTYTVKKGDNLWNISKAHLGDPTKWPSIHQLNRNAIKNPDLIYPNQVLKLPILAQPAQPVQPVEPPAQPVQPAEPVATEPSPQPVQPAQPAEPVATEPTPQPVQPTPPTPPAIVTPAEPAKSKSNLGKAALIGGAVGAVGTAATLSVMTARLAAPLSNLGGYGTAQVVAGKLAHLGLKVPQGPALSKLVSSVGGPKVAAAGVAVGVGLAAAGLAAGGYYLYKKATDK